jgi:hypothetical protein
MRVLDYWRGLRGMGHTRHASAYYIASKMGLVPAWIRWMPR